MYKMKELIDRYKKIPLPLKASFWFLVCNILLKGISFFTTPMFAKILSDDEYGKLTIFSSYEQIIVIFATWEVGLSPFQRGALKFKDKIELFRTNVLLVPMIISLLLMVIGIVFSDALFDFTEMPLWLLLSLLIYSLFYTAYVSWMTENKLQYNYKHVSIMTVSMSIMQIVCALVAVKCFYETAEIKLLFTLIPTIIVSIILFVKRFRPLQVVDNKKEAIGQLLFIIKFAGPLVIHSLSYLILGQADRIMIGKMVSNSAAGLYGVAYMIASVVIIVQSAALQVLSPWIYHKMSDGSFDDIRSKCSSILLFVSILYIIFMLVAPDVIIIMYPQQYWEGIWCIPPISMGVYFMFMYSLFVTIEECLDETKYIAMVSIICALTNVILNYFGIKVFGYVACAYTTLFCYILFAAGHYYFMSKIVKQKVGKIKVYDGKMILSISFIMLIVMIGITFLYNNRSFRYIAVLLMIVLCVIKRKKIISLYKQLISTNN